MRELEEYIYQHVLDSSCYDSIMIDEFSDKQLVELKTLIDKAINDNLSTNKSLKQTETK